MYKVELKDSYFPATKDHSVINCTIGQLLQKTVVDHRDTEALVEITQAGVS